MKYDYIIVGGGPTGIYLSILLNELGKNVLVLESEDNIGGCWKTTWKNDYYTEHSPKVMVGKYNHFESMLKKLNVKPEYKNVYSNTIDTYIKFAKFFLTNLNNRELFLFIKGYLSSKINSIDTTMSLHDWLKINKFSKKGYKTIRTLSLAFSDIPEKFLAKSFFNTFVFGTIVQLTEPGEWINAYEEYTINSNIHLIKNCTVTSYNIDALQTNKGVFRGNNYIFCVPIYNLGKIIENSNTSFKNNWMPYSEMTKLITMSTYSGFGFQLHFDYKINTNNQTWCWSCEDDWTIILTEVQKFRKSFSIDANIKTVWSCVLIDTNAYSKRLRKTVNECCYNEVIIECIYQMEKKLKTSLRPKVITSYDGLYKENGVWRSKDSSYTNILGNINQKGKYLDNVYIVNACNDGSSATVMETGLKSANDFVEKYVQKRKDPFYKMVIFVIIFSLIIYSL